MCKSVLTQFRRAISFNNVNTIAYLLPVRIDQNDKKSFDAGIKEISRPIRSANILSN